jgi:hypothetical protein
MKMYNMTVADVSIATGLRESSVYAARHQGKLMAKQAHNGRIFFAEEDVKLWRDNTNVWQYDPEALPCGGYNNYRTLKIKQGIHRHVNMGHWTDFDFCIKWEAYKDIDEGVSKKSLHDTMVEKAETLIDALETIDKNRLPNNNVLKS